MPKTEQEWFENAKSVPLNERDNPKIEPKQNKKLTKVKPKEPYLVRYNNPPGLSEVNLSQIVHDGIVTSAGVADESVKKMAYVSYFYNPPYNQISSKLYILPLENTFPLTSRIQNANILKSKKVEKGTKIINQYEEGNEFYILEEGKATAWKELDGKERNVFEYSPGSYFGELALLYNAPRAASIKADTDCKLLTLDRMSFKRLLGPLENILQRNSEKYVKYVKK